MAYGVAVHKDRHVLYQTDLHVNPVSAFFQSPDVTSACFFMAHFQMSLFLKTFKNQLTWCSFFLFTKHYIFVIATENAAGHKEKYFFSAPMWTITWSEMKKCSLGTDKVIPCMV